MTVWIDVLIGFSVFCGLVVLWMVCCGSACYYLRWTPNYVRRYGQPNRFREAICCCYPVVWVNVCPKTYPCLRRWIPRDRTLPQVAPGARFMTHTGHVESNVPPPSYDDLNPSGGGVNREPAEPPQYDKLVVENEEALPSYQNNMTPD